MYTEVSNTIPLLPFKESNGYSAPIHQDLLDELSVRGWKLIEVIGIGSTNVAFLAENNGKKATVLIPISQEYPEEKAKTVMKLQEQGKLRSFVHLYDWFYTEIVVDKENLRRKIEERIVMYPDYVSDAVGYNILIEELLTPLKNSGLKDGEIINGIEEVLISLSVDGWEQCDLHINNFGVSESGEIKAIDLEGFCEESQPDFSRFIDKLKNMDNIYV
jgi:hypothetical protein